MKKIFLTLAVMLTTLVSANAMSYEQARDQALFLTDKMAYELDLNEEQYEAAFEVNLDYLMSITTADDVYADYWTRRNLDLSYILFDWQYRTFCGLDYFYRPLYWGDGFWHFRIYAHYPHHDYFYFGRPGIYFSYRGGHSWVVNGGRSWYYGRHFGSRDFGMRGGWDRGHYHNISHGWRSNDGGNRIVRRESHFGGSSYGGGNRGGHVSERGGSRTDRNYGGNRTERNFGGNTDRGGRSERGYSNGSSSSDRGSRTFRSYGGEQNRVNSARQSSTRETVRSSSSSRQGSYSGYTPSRSFSGGSSSSGSSRGSFSGGGHSGGHFSGGHSGGSFSGGGHSGSGHSGGGHFGSHGR